MEILNKKERRNSFLLFLLMLVITLGTLMLGLFFNNKLPWKENAILRKENKQVQYELNYQVRFSQELKILNKALDSLDKASDGYFFIEKSINSDLVDLRRRIPKDSLKNHKLYDDMVLNYKRLLDAKSIVKRVENSKKQINKLNETIQEYEKDIEELERALELSKRLNRN
jgi:Zn-dependent M32 family carboxypeptidase